MKYLRNSRPSSASILLVAMLIIGAVNPAFWDLDNLFSLLKSNIVIGIMALVVLLVMISGGIDVSFPAIAVAGMYLTVNGMLITRYDGVLIPFAISTLIGLCLGALNALLVHRFKMIPLIVTLGTASIVRGLVLGIVGTSMINIDRFPKVLINFTKADIYDRQAGRNDLGTDQHAADLRRRCRSDTRHPEIHDARPQHLWQRFSSTS